MKQIGIYSGTFDPVHPGHVAFARTARELCKLDEILFLPERTPRAKRGVTDLAHRVALLEQGLRGQSGMRVLTLQTDQFTVKDTLPEIRAQTGNAQLTMLIGSDVVRTFPYRWEGLDTLLREIPLVIGMRTGDNAAETKAIVATLEQELVCTPTYMDADYADLTSSQIRDSIANTVHLDAWARSYIQQHGLYA
jgi:nicotinate-nucleotide adenylyltransferase